MDASGDKHTRHPTSRARDNERYGGGSKVYVLGAGYVHSIMHGETVAKACTTADLIIV